MGGGDGDGGLLRDPRRDASCEGLQALLGEAITGIVCSDRWAVYNKLPLEQRQVCWAHLKRDFQKLSIEAAPAEAIGRAGLEVVEDVCSRLVGPFRGGDCDRPGLAGACWSRLPRELRAALERGARCADAKAATFCDNLLALYPALWLFAAIEGVEPTNNHAERIAAAGRAVAEERLRLPQRGGMPVRGADADGGADPAVAEAFGPGLPGSGDHRSSVGPALASITGAEVGLNGYIFRLSVANNQQRCRNSS